MPNLSDPVPISSIPGLNRGLSSADEDTMIEMLGRPREPLTTTCSDDKASAAVMRLMETRRITENFRLTGIKPALDSVQSIIAKVKQQNPDLIAQLRTEGMLCVRHRKPTSGAPSLRISNHSWGTAVDFRLDGQDAPGNTGPNCPRWLAILVPFFNQEGWFSGLGFTARDAMHFEVADETIRKWQRDGLLGGEPAREPIVVAGNQTNGGPDTRPGTGAGAAPPPPSLLAPVTGFFSRIFGHG
ncbi:MAG TPA: M15 family metallopeptidase [Pseudolabrys sp.]|nr:M15 family metallopeptidase [Pseudolabrys sp.]